MVQLSCNGCSLLGRGLESEIQYSRAVDMLALFHPALSSSAGVRGPKSLSRGCFQQLLMNHDSLSVTAKNCVCEL